jgi:hypothetical protein
MSLAGDPGIRDVLAFAELSILEFRLVNAVKGKGGRSDKSEKQYLPARGCGGRAIHHVPATGQGRGGR